MEAVWDRGEASIREVMEDLNARPTSRARTPTFMSVMARLTAKDC